MIESPVNESLLLGPGFLPHLKLHHAGGTLLGDLPHGGMVSNVTFLHY
jgi:hypothetical protein